MKYSSVKSFKGKTLTLTPVNKDYLINVNNNCLHIGNNDQLKLKICNHILNDTKHIKILSINTNAQDNNIYPLKFSFIDYTFIKKMCGIFYYENRLTRHIDMKKLKSLQQTFYKVLPLVPLQQN